MIAFAGHSNGAGEAAYIGTQAPLARVIMISGAADSTSNDDGSKAPAPWVNIGATPATHYFGFAHEQDIVNPQMNRILRIETDWDKLRLPGPRTNIDNAVPPYGGVHMLTTDLAPCQSCNPHNMVAVNHTPIAANGFAVYAPVWRYMLSAPVN